MAKIEFVSRRRRPVTDVMMRAAQAQASNWDLAVTADQVKTLLDLGLPRSVQQLPEAASASQISELIASEMLEAAEAANISARPWAMKAWQWLVCASGRHSLEPALAHPDYATARSIRSELHECPYCERSYVYESGRGWYDFPMNTRMAEHRDRVKRIEAAWAADKSTRAA